MERAQFHQAVREQTPRVWVTPTLIAANVIVFGLMAARGVNPISPSAESVIPWGADYGPFTLGGDWWRLITATFIHFGIIHIAMNMFVLWGMGGFVERLYGNVPFLVLYLAAGLAGSLVSVLWNPIRVSAGASGAVFGVYGALGAYLLRRRAVIPRGALGDLWQTTATFILYNVLFGFSARGIDNAAHLGGLAGGFVFGLIAAAPLGASRGRRLAPAVIVAALAIGMTVIGLRTREAPHDFMGQANALQTLYTEIDQLDQKTRARYNELLGEMKAQTKRPADVADVIEKEILPSLRAKQKLVEALDRSIPTVKPQFQPPVMLRYLYTVQDAWRRIAAGVRGNDDDQVSTGVRMLEEAGHVFEDAK